MIIDCSNFTDNETSPITNSCALFDFTLYTVFVGSLCLMGVVGNAISFVVLRKDTGGQPATTFLLRALAAADTLVLLAAVPLYVLPAIYPHAGYLKEYYTLYMGIMPFLWPVYLVPFTGAVFLTVLVSLDRYIAVCRPLKSSQFLSRHRIRLLVLVIALSSVVYNIPRFFEYEMKQKCTGPNTSETMFELSAFGDNIFYRIIYANALYFVVLHGGPLLSLGFFNYKLVQALRARQRRRAEMRKPRRAQKDITLVLIVVICVFIVCQTPTLIDHVLWTFVSGDQRSCGHWHYYYTAIGDALAILNSSVNFVIYVLTSQRFRRRLWLVCRMAAEGAIEARNFSETAEAETRLYRMRATSVGPDRTDFRLERK